MFEEFGEFYDSCAHAECLRMWHRRDEFVAYFNAAALRANMALMLVVGEDGSVTFAKRST